MAIELSKQEVEGAVDSLRKYFNAELEQELSDMHAKFLLEYFLKEIAPLAYNKGVRDAEKYFLSKAEGVSIDCFEEGMTYWHKKRK